MTEFELYQAEVIVTLRRVCEQRDQARAELAAERERGEIEEEARRNLERDVIGLMAERDTLRAELDAALAKGGGDE